MMDYKGRCHFPPLPSSNPMTDKRGKRWVDPPSATSQNWQRGLFKILTMHTIVKPRIERLNIKSTSGVSNFVNKNALTNKGKLIMSLTTIGKFKKGLQIADEKPRKKICASSGRLMRYNICQELDEWENDKLKLPN